MTSYSLYAGVDPSSGPLLYADLYLVYFTAGTVEIPP
jgi:hypothetical protein